MTVKRITFLQELLAFIGLDGRLHLEWISSAEARKYVRVVTEFTDKIRRMGPNPLKGYEGAFRVSEPAAHEGPMERLQASETEIAGIEA